MFGNEKSSLSQGSKRQPVLQLSAELEPVALTLRRTYEV